MEELYEEIIKKLKNLHLKGEESIYASKQDTKGISPLKRSWFLAVSNLTGVEFFPQTLQGKFYLVYKGDENLVNLLGQLEIRVEKVIKQKIKEISEERGLRDRQTSVLIKTQLYNELMSKLMLSDFKRFKK